MMSRLAGLCTGLTIRLHLASSCRQVHVWAFRRCKSSAEDKYTTGPLSKIRVVDLTRVLAGPFCTMLLGDLGAEVIKIEKPGSGDDTRSWGPPFMNSESVYFMSVNRNKKLVSKSDILVENYVPGKLDDLHLGHEHLMKLNPALIYCSITGFGETGPYTKRAGYDVIASAIGGLMHITGSKDGDPVKVGVAMTDLATGLYAHGAIMAALIERQKTGRGQRIQCNLLSSQVALLTHIACNYLNAGIEAQRWGTAHGSIVPYQGFQTSDGWVVVGAGNNRHFQDLCQRIQLPQLLSEKKYSSNENRVKHRNELIDILTERFLQQTTAHWLELLEGCGFPYGPINNIHQVFNDPQVHHLGIVDSVQHPTAGRVLFPGPAVGYSTFQQPTRLPPPILGQHSTEILKKLLQYNSEEIEKLLEDKIV